MVPNQNNTGLRCCPARYAQHLTLTGARQAKVLAELIYALRR